MVFLATGIRCLIKTTFDKMSSFVQTSNATEWTTRSENLQADLLQLFERADFYDCTFQLVSKDSAVKQEFKCHKLLLSASSCVFATMLYGHFKEAGLGADEPILLHGVSPEAFHAAMRFVYGQEKKFGSFDLSMEVYKFAHEMQITSLLHSVDQELLQSINVVRALKLFDLYVQLENNKGLQICKQLLSGKSSEAFRSAAWLSVSEAVVEEVLQMDQLDASEPEVAAALLQWGRAQVAADGHDPSDPTKLRQKVDRCLKLIRFAQLDAVQFNKLCEGDLGLVLSWQEKFQLINCVVHRNWATMPLQLRPPRATLRTRLSFSLELDMKFFDLVCAKQLQAEHDRLVVSVDKRVCFVGLRFVPSDLKAAACANVRPCTVRVVQSSLPDATHGKCNVDGDVFKLAGDCVFEAGTCYEIQFLFPPKCTGSARKLHPTYKVDAAAGQTKVQWDDGTVLALSVHFSPVLGVNVKELMFKRLE